MRAWRSADRALVTTGYAEIRDAQRLPADASQSGASHALAWTGRLPGVVSRLYLPSNHAHRPAGVAAPRPSEMPTMDRARTLELLIRSKPILAARYGVARVALFGSAARDTTHPTSDLDILVSFDGPATADRYFGVQFYLEDLLGRPVDLVTDKALRPELRPFVERDAQYV